MIDSNMRECEYCKELGQLIILAYKDPDIDPDKMIGNLLASLHMAQIMDHDRVQHFYTEGYKTLKENF